MKNTNKIKLIAIDLDHTLTNFNDFLSTKNKLVIWKAQNIGINVVIVTGRGFQKTKKIAKKLKINENSDRVICLNGAITYQLSTEKILDIVYLPTKFIQFITKKKEIKITKIFVDQHDHFYSSKKNLWTLGLKILFWKRMHFVDRKTILKQEIVSGFIFGSKQKIKKATEKYAKFKNVFFASGYPFTSQFSATNKGEALKKLAKKEKINCDEIIAFGDSLNDFELFKYVKYGIAMKNAHHKIKKISFDETTHWKKNGVANGIKKFLF